MEVSKDVTEVAARVARILDGADEKASGRRRFTEWFLRPAGLNRPVSPIVANVLENMALGRQTAAGGVAGCHDEFPGLIMTAEGVVQ